MSGRRLGVGVTVVVVVVAVVAGLVWFLSGDPDDDRNTSGFAPPPVTRASFCRGLAGFQADFANVDPNADPAAYVAQLRTAAQRLKATGTPPAMPADLVGALDHFLAAILALPTDAPLTDVARLGRDDTPAQKQQRKALDAYLASECPPSVG